VLIFFVNAICVKRSQAKKCHKYALVKRYRKPELSWYFERLKGTEATRKTRDTRICPLKTQLWLFGVINLG